MLEVYTWFVAKEKAIYTSLNCLRSLETQETTYTGFFWAPMEYEVKIKEMLTAFPTVDLVRWKTEEMNKPVELTPPTFYKLSEI